MSNELQTYQGPPQVNPFQRAIGEHVNQGAVEIESSRAVAEAQGKLVIAKRFPRNEAQAYAKVIDACKRKGLAEEATYSYPKGGKTITGPTIRLAEELARNWGNLDYGIRELSRRPGAGANAGVSEMEAYCWDMETNVISSQKFTVTHIRDKSDGGGIVSTERDIYELTANMGARRLRARILAILPPDIVEDALSQCRETMKGNVNEPMADRVKKVVKSFDRYGVSATMIEARIGKPMMEMLPDDFADLTEIRNSIKSGATSPRDWFSVGPKEREESTVLDGEGPATPPQPPPAAATPAAEAPASTARRTRKPAQAAPAPQPEPQPTPQPAAETKPEAQSNGPVEADDIF